MPLSDAINAYNDCYQFFEKALEDTKGVRVQFSSKEEAQFFQIRMNYARTLQRRDSKRIFPENSPLWNRSEFDQLVVRSPRADEDGKWWIYVEHQGLNVLAVESLGGVDAFGDAD